MEEITVKPARSIRTGDYLMVGPKRRLVIQARVTESAVILSHPGGAVSTMEPSTRLRVLRQSRTEDHDQAAEVPDLVHTSQSPEAALRATAPRDLTVTPESLRVREVNFSQPERTRPVHRSESARPVPSVRFKSAGA